MYDSVLQKYIKSKSFPATSTYSLEVVSFFFFLERKDMSQFHNGVTPIL